MSYRALVIFVLTVLAAALGFVGCGGGGGEPTLADTPTRTSSPGATPTSTPTVEELSLNEYLVLTLRMDADMSRIAADLSEALPNLQAGQQFVDATVELERALSQVAGEAADTLVDLTPPREAESYHIALFGLLRSLSAVAEETAAALESGNQSRIAAALGDFTGLLADLGEVGGEGQRLVITALAADGDSPLNAYLISAAEARLQVVTAVADFGARLQTAATPDAALAILEELIATLEDFDDRWQELSPPSEAQELHQRQAELIANTLAGESLLMTALRDEDQTALLAASEQLLEIATEGEQSGGRLGRAVN